ncbi:MAG: PD-(D/E)XK nuclease family protein [Treponemataceae bacterium]
MEESNTLAIFENSDIRNFCKNIHKIQKKYNLKDKSSFNIFSVISNTYHHENMHSQILQAILNPHTQEIGNHQNLVSFCKLLEKIRFLTSKINKPITIPAFDIRNVIVECEHKTHTNRRIDILIHDKNNCIIIENKVNNAADQDKQLEDYYDYCKNTRGWTVSAIVYLTLTSFKTPPNKNKNNEISKILVHLPCIDQKKIDLAHGFLDTLNNDNETSNVFIQQYSNLLKGTAMQELTAEDNKKIITKIYENKDLTQHMNTLFNVWKDESLRINLILNKVVSEKISFEKDMAFINLDEEIKAFVHIDGSCGFVARDLSCELKNRKKILEILEPIAKNHAATISDKNGNEYPSWVYFLCFEQLIADPELAEKILLELEEAYIKK